MTRTDEVGTKSDEVVVECEMEATPEKLWRALTEEAFLADWLSAHPVEEGEVPPDGLSFRIVDAEPYNRLSYTWHDSDYPDVRSTVTVELERLSGGRTWFRLTHGATAAKVAPAAANMNQPFALAA